MSKARVKAPSIYSLSSYLKEDNLLPIYFFFGEDHYTIDGAVKAVEKALQGKVESDFDREVVNADKKNNIAELMDLASAFPFGGGAKVITIKNFEKLNEKKKFSSYVNDPAEFTHLIITYSGKISGFVQEPFASLLSKGYLFEARKLTGRELVQWTIKTANRHKLSISQEVAQVMVDVIGDEKGIIEMQLNKLSDYLDEGAAIEIDHIKNSVSSTKENSIFELQDSLGQGNKNRAIDVAMNLLKSGNDLNAIMGMLSKYIIILAKSLELSRKNPDMRSAAREAGVSEYYYKNCLKGRYLQSESRLLQASRALYNADLRIKTSAGDSKTIVIMMISEMLNDSSQETYI